MALGGNSGMESVVVLTNHLRRMLEAERGKSPNKTSIRTTFQAYQDERLPRMRHIMRFSSTISRVQAWDSWLLKTISIYLLPYLPQRKLANDLGEIIRKAPKLDFVPLGQWNEGLLEWEDMKAATAKKTGRWQHMQLPLLGAIFTISSVYWVLRAKSVAHDWML